MRKTMTLKYIELNALKGLMKENKATYAVMSEVLNTTSMTLCSKVNGYHLFNVKEISDICDYLDIDSTDIPRYFFPQRIKSDRYGR